MIRLTNLDLRPSSEKHLRHILSYNRVLILLNAEAFWGVGVMLALGNESRNSTQIIEFFCFYSPVRIKNP